MATSAEGQNKNDEIRPFEPGLEKLGGLSLEEFRDESNKKALVVTDDSKAKVRAIATQWRDQDRRKKFLEDANITDEKQVAAMWEATEAWLTHASSAIPERLISFVDPAVKERWLCHFFLFSNCLIMLRLTQLYTNSDACQQRD